MKEAMRCAALTFPGVNEIAIGEVELPDLGAQDVLIRTECSFVSTGTERWTLEGRMGRRQDGTSFPLVPGYQKVGRVEAVGPEVTRFEPGQRVLMTKGRIRSGGSAQWGGHMQYSLESESEVYALPDEVPSTAAAALVVLQVGWNNARRPSLSPGDLALVIGDGIIGQFTAQALRARGAEVWLAGRHCMRLDLGLQWSADRVLDVGEEDLFEAAQSARPGGMDIVVETVCRPDDTPLYLSMLRRRGQLVLAAYHPESNWVDMAPAQDKEITCHTTGGWNRDRMEAALAALARGDFQVTPLITHEVDWRTAPSAYERLVRDRSEDALGIAIRWTRERPG